MATIFEQLQTALQGSTVSVHLTAQTGNLSKVGALIQHPPNAVGDLSRGIQGLPLPNLQISGDFSASLTSLKAAVPTDLSSVIGPLTSQLQTLQTSVGGDLPQTLESALKAVLALSHLTVSFSVQASASPGGPPPVPAAAPGPAPAPAAAPPTGAALDQASQFLNLLPSPLNVDTFLPWLNEMLGALNLDSFIRQVPILDEIRDPLDTLVQWKGMQPAQIRDQMAATLTQLQTFIHSSIDAALASPAASLTAITGHLHADTLAQIADGLTARLGDLLTAVKAANTANIGTAVTAINGLLDQFDTTKAGLQTEVLNGLPALHTRLSTLPEDLDDRMSYILSVLRPDVTLSFLEALTPQLQNAASAQALQQLEASLKAAIAWFDGLLDSVDLSAVKGPLQTLANGAKTTVDGFDSAMVTVTLEVQKLFGQVEALVDKVDTAALVAQVQKAIDDFKNTLIRQLSDLFQPVRDAVTKVIAEISAGVDAFQPQDIVDSLKDAIDKVTGVLQSPEITSALGDIQNALNAATSQLQSLSFAPLTDQVVKELEDLTAALKAIDPDQLSLPVKGALTAAVAVLPSDLTPVTDPLLKEFDKLVEEGPIPLVNQVKALPDKLLVQVRHFEPTTLVGDALSKPFQDLLKQADNFKPTHLLTPIEGEMTKFKNRLKQNADPGQLLKPLEPPFNALLKAFDSLHPEDLVKPLEEGIKKVIDTILKALPVEDVFKEVDKVLTQIADAVTVGDRLAALLKNLHDKLAGFDNAPAQMQAWIESILTKVDAIADTAPIQAQLTALGATLDSTMSAPLLARFTGASDPLLTALEGLKIQARLASLVQAYRALPAPAIAALPDSPDKTALIAILARFNPMQPAFAAPWQALDDLRRDTANARTALQTALADWNARYHGADGTLAQLRNLQATPASLRQWLMDDLDPRFIKPMTALFSLVQPFNAGLAVYAAQMQQLSNDLKAKVDGILLGPGSLKDSVETIQQLIQRLRDLNLGFLRDSLKDLFANVRGKLNALSPANLRQIIEKAFSDMLDTITLSLVLPPDDTKKLDDDYAAVIAKLKALDPGTLVIQVVQPEFDQKVLPLLTVFDVTPLLTALVDRLHGLETELKSELGEINTAYKAMLDAVPKVGLGDVLGSVDIDVGISF